MRVPCFQNSFSLFNSSFIFQYSTFMHIINIILIRLVHQKQRHNRIYSVCPVIYLYLLCSDTKYLTVLVVFLLSCRTETGDIIEALLKESRTSRSRIEQICDRTKLWNLLAFTWSCTALQTWWFFVWQWGILTDKAYLHLFADFFIFASVQMLLIFYKRDIKPVNIITRTRKMCCQLFCWYSFKLIPWHRNLTDNFAISKLKFFYWAVWPVGTSVSHSTAHCIEE